MARMPDAVWLGEHSPRTPMTRYDVVCVHTIVGRAPAHAAHFSVKADGTILQSRDTAYRSAANLDGNHRVIAIENEDHGPAFGGTPRLPGWVPLTAEQVDANARILAWAHTQHGVPLDLCPDSRPFSRGLAYHRQGVDGDFAGYRHPGRVPGGEKWSSAFGKVCPTDARIDQLPAILARARAITAEESPMNLRDLFRYRLYGKKQGNRTFADVVRDMDTRLEKIASDVDAIRQAQEGTPPQGKA